MTDFEAHGEPQSHRRIVPIDTDDPEVNPLVAYEKTGASSWGLGLSAGVLISIVVMVFLFAGGVFVFFNRDAPHAKSTFPLPSAPRLQAAPQEDWQAMQREQKVRLESYGWVDKTRGVAHIPIERAMDEMAR